jgi:uncharacterized short protein YbdD (DUF466 family)
MNTQIILLSILIFFILLFIIVTQPTLTKQRSKAKPTLANVESLKKYVHEIVEKFPDRSYNNYEELNRTAHYIHSEFAQYTQDIEFEAFKVYDFLGAKYKVEDFATKDYIEYQNVVASFKGTHPKANEVVVVGAHYDTYAGHAGANDNTSAVAALIEIARVLSLHPPKSNVLVVAYCLEEPPFFGTHKMGSFHHAQKLKLGGKKVKLAIVMDMIGYYSDAKDSQKYPMPIMKLFYPDRANYISVVSNLSLQNIAYTRHTKNTFKRSSNLSVYSINAPAIIQGVDFSDHRNYWKFDYPAVMITDTAFYRSENYHTPNDTPDTLNYENMAKVVDGIFELVSKL